MSSLPSKCPSCIHCITSQLLRTPLRPLALRGCGCSWGRRRPGAARRSWCWRVRSGRLGKLLASRTLGKGTRPACSVFMSAERPNHTVVHARQGLHGCTHMCACYALTHFGTGRSTRTHVRNAHTHGQGHETFSQSGQALYTYRKLSLILTHRRHSHLTCPHSCQGARAQPRMPSPSCISPHVIAHTLSRPSAPALYCIFPHLIKYGLSLVCVCERAYTRSLFLHSRSLVEIHLVFSLAFIILRIFYYRMPLILSYVSFIIACL